MIKAFIAGMATILIAAACFLMPTRLGSIAAYPENLFTGDGQWRQPSTRPFEKFRAVRTEYGYPYAWLVVDRGVKEDAWYAKKHDGLLAAYTVCALALGGAVFVFLARRRRVRPE
jgi:hypothetical protein